MKSFILGTFVVNSAIFFNFWSLKGFERHFFSINSIGFELINLFGLINTLEKQMSVHFLHLLT